MKRFAVAVVAWIGCLTLGLSLAMGGPWRNRRPVIESFTADRTVVKLGESVRFTWTIDPVTATSATVGFESPHYTWQDPTRVPLSGFLILTPIESGDWVLIARNRRRDANKNGRADGWRRSSRASVPITVEEN